MRFPTRRPLIASLGACLVLAASAAAKDPGDEPFSVKLDVREKVLQNGLRVLVAPRRRAPRVSCAMWFKVGSVDEQPGKTGLAHVLEHMMFKGTHRIGVKDASLGENLADQLDAAWERRTSILARLGQEGLLRLRSEERARLARARSAELRLLALALGATDSLEATAEEARAVVALAVKDSPDARLFRELRAAEEEHARLLLEERANDRKEELWDLYVQAGGTGLNAFTSEDTTCYVVTLPSNKLELFMWLEADRLGDAVFREWYAELDVVKEERRIDENSPDGPYNEGLNAVVYGPHPYGHPVLGWSKDLDGMRRADARRFYETYYSPDNATCVLVGDVDPDAAFALAARYLGKVPRRRAPPPVSAAEPTAPGEKRLTVDAEAEARVEIYWKTPERDSPDRDVLDVIASILSGEMGRLYQDLVVAKEIAITTEASDDVRRFASRFKVGARAKADTDLAALEAALRADVASIVSEDVTDEELERAKNRIAAEHVRGLEDLEGTCERLGATATIQGDWRRALDRPERANRVTKEDVRRVAARTFVQRGSTVGVLRRRAPEPRPDDAPEEPKPERGPPPPHHGHRVPPSHGERSR
ncbi:insulinase family protein [bacterium]|nr:insulinase family protein [bacterium]